MGFQVVGALGGEDEMPGSNDLLSSEDLAALEAKVLEIPLLGRRSRPGKRDRVIGYAPGAWDMFHIGHLNLLLRVRPMCDHLIVGVASDAAVELAKSKRPVIALAERMQIVAALGLVDQVVVDQGSKLDVYHRHPFDVLFKGDDWLGTPKGDKLIADMASVGARVEFLSYTTGISSTRLRQITSAV